MTRQRDPELTERVDRVRELLSADSKLSIAKACREVGGISPAAYRYRRDNPDAAADRSQADDLTGELDPGEIPVIVREYDAESHFVYPMGDSHLGSPHHQREQWSEWLSYLERTPNTSFLGTGDQFNVALKDSVSDVYSEDLTLDQAKRLEGDALAKLAEANRIDGLADGNHERRLVKAAGTSPVADLAWKLDVAYIPASALLVYRIGDVEYTLYLWHGAGSGRAGAQANRLERQQQIVIADIYVSGHTHRQQALLGDVFDLDREHLVLYRRKQVFLSSGSFLSYEPYAAQMGLPPAHTGAPRIRLDGRRHDVHVSL